jgi:hypothetical protein
MAKKQTDTITHRLSNDEWFDLVTKRPEVVERFPEPICLTSEKNDPVLWAVGRSKSGEIMVESHSHGEVYPARLFSSFMNHAPDLAIEAMQHPIFHSEIMKDSSASDSVNKATISNPTAHPRKDNSRIIRFVAALAAVGAISTTVPITNDVAYSEKRYNIKNNYLINSRSLVGTAIGLAGYGLYNSLTKNHTELLGKWRADHTVDNQDIVYIFHENLKFESEKIKNIDMKYSIDGTYVNIKSDNGYYEKAEIIWKDENHFEYHIIDHSDIKQKGFRILFTRLLEPSQSTPTSKLDANSKATKE